MMEVTIVDQIFQLLNQSPLVSIIGGFVLSIVLAIILQEQIKDYIKKKFNLYTREEAVVALTEVMYNPEIKRQEIEISRNLSPKEQILKDNIINRFSTKLSK